MKLVILLLISFHFALGQKVMNEEFRRCSQGGWSCQHLDGTLRINFTCTPKNNYVRYSVFFSRSFPPETDVLTALDCDTFEIYFGCLHYPSSSVLREIRAINVTHVKFVEFNSINFADYYFENVREITIDQYNIRRLDPDCDKFNVPVSLTVLNSHIKTLNMSLLNVDALVMQNVVIDTIDVGGISAKGNIAISETTFPNIPEYGIHISGENVYFVNNTFKRITLYSINVSSTVFEFSHNYVEKISCRGLRVEAKHIKINNNVFNHLEARALQNITTFDSAGTATFNFSNNLIKNMKPKSLQMDLKPCVEITIENNSIDCSCRNIFWITSVLVNDVGSVIDDHLFYGFYGYYLTGREYNCIGHEDSPLDAAAPAIQQSCTKSTKSSGHQLSNHHQTSSRTKSTNSSGHQLSNHHQTLSRTKSTNSSGHQLSNHHQTSMINWIAFISVILILAIISSVVYMLWRKKNLMVSSIRNWCFK